MGGQERRFFCQRCEKEYFPLKKTWETTKYCSRLCHNRANAAWLKENQIGKRNPNFLTGRFAYRTIAFAGLPNECELCGKKKGLHVHHRDKNKLNNEINNLQITCPACHNGAIHTHERKANGQFKKKEVTYVG